MKPQRGLMSRIQQEARRRSKHPRPQAVDFGPVSDRVRDAVTEEHVHLMVALERTLVILAQAGGDAFDDAWAVRSIKQALMKQPSDDALANLGHVSLRQLCVGYANQQGDTFDDEICDDALRIVLDSVKTRHEMSDGYPCGYLEFAAAFTEQPAKWPEVVQLLELANIGP